MRLRNVKSTVLLAAVAIAESPSAGIPAPRVFDTTICLRSADMILHDWLFINSTLRASIYTALFISAERPVRPRSSGRIIHGFSEKHHPRYSARCRKIVSSLSSFISNSYRVYLSLFLFFQTDSTSTNLTTGWNLTKHRSSSLSSYLSKKICAPFRFPRAARTFHREFNYFAE